jgi:hypothetical protein
MLTAKFRIKIRHAIGVSRFVFLDRVMQAGTVFLLASFAWIFFRAKNISVAIKIIKWIAVGVPHYFRQLITDRGASLLSPLQALTKEKSLFELFIVGVMVLLLFVVDWVARKGSAREWLTQKPAFFRWSAYLGLFFLILFFGVYHNKNEFIYFQF